MTNEFTMTENNIPPRPPHSYRITLTLNSRKDRMDNVLLEALHNQTENITLKNLSRTALKALFKDGKILIKGQRATQSSALAKGTTYVDILGF